jgi:hypothetical protein
MANGVNGIGRRSPRPLERIRKRRGTYFSMERIARASSKRVTVQVVAMLRRNDSSRAIRRDRARTRSRIRSVLGAIGERAALASARHDDAETLVLALRFPDRPSGTRTLPRKRQSPTKVFRRDERFFAGISERRYNARSAPLGLPNNLADVIASRRHHLLQPAPPAGCLQGIYIARHGR